jgi:hypothetical protein
MHKDHVPGGRGHHQRGGTVRGLGIDGTVFHHPQDFFSGVTEGFVGNVDASPAGAAFGQTFIDQYPRTIVDQQFWI